MTKVKGAKHGAQEGANEADVVTFNIYGAAAKDPKKAFGDTDAWVQRRHIWLSETLANVNHS